MKIDVSNGKDPYDAVSKVMEDILHKIGYGYDTYILHIRTGNCGDTNVIWTHDDYNTWDYDWYEGGDVELLGWVRVYELDIPNNVDM